MNKKDKALVAALEANDFSAAAAAIRAGANPNSKIDGVPLLVGAAATAEVEMVRFLLAHGADKDAFSRDHRTAMGWLACFGNTPDHLKIADMLIEAKADLEIPDAQGARPLDRALQMKNHALADKLEAAGAVLTSQAALHKRRNARESGQQPGR